MGGSFTDWVGGSFVDGVTGFDGFVGGFTRSFTGFGDSAGDLAGSDFPAGRGFIAGLSPDLAGVSAGFTSLSAGLVGLAGFGGEAGMAGIGSSSLEGRWLLSESVGAIASKRVDERSSAPVEVLYMRLRVEGLFWSLLTGGSGWTDSSLGWLGCAFAASLETIEIISKMESSLSFGVCVRKVGEHAPGRDRWEGD